MTEKELRVLYGELIANCWEDDEFKAKFIANPAAVMQEAGLPVEANVEYKVIEAPRSVNYIILPHEQLAEAVQAIAKLMLTAAESENQILVPPGREIRIIQNTPATRYIILHEAPDPLAAAEMDLLASNGKNVNYSANVNIGGNVTVAVNVEATVNVTTLNVAAEAVVVAVGAIVFI